MRFWYHLWLLETFSYFLLLTMWLRKTSWWSHQTLHLVGTFGKGTFKIATGCQTACFLYTNLHQRVGTLGVCVCACVWVLRLFAVPWIVTLKFPLSMEFSRQEYWSGLPCPSPGDLPDPEFELGSAALQVNSLPAELSGKPFLKPLNPKSMLLVWELRTGNVDLSHQYKHWHKILQEFLWDFLGAV